MRRLVSNLMSVAVLCFLSVAASGNDHNLKEHFTFNNDVLIGDTMVKKGNYLVTYDPTTREMQVKKGSKVVARAIAAVTVRNEAFDQDALLTMTTPEGTRLMGLRLGGEHEELTITGGDVTITEDGFVFTVDLIGPE